MSDGPRDMRGLFKSMRLLVVIADDDEWVDLLAARGKFDNPDMIKSESTLFLHPIRGGLIMERLRGCIPEVAE